MYISPITITEGEQTFKISAEIRFKNRQDKPKHLWYEFPMQYLNDISRTGESFLIALLQLAMVYDEDIEFDGKISSRLLIGLQEYQNIFHFWAPDKFRKINITHQGLQEEPQSLSPVRGAASSFSGGVDSYYTVWLHNHQPTDIPQYKLTHLFFMNGFDIMGLDETFNTCVDAYREFAQRVGIELITGNTNVRDFLNADIAWDYVYGSSLIAISHFFSNIISSFYIPSSTTIAVPDPHGSTLLTDPLLSSNKLEIFHDGPTVSRYEKLEAIATWPETYTGLRVCWKNPDGLKNCCRCEKCLRTMIMLDLHNALPYYKTFPHPLERSSIRGIQSPGTLYDSFLHHNYALAKQMGKKEMMFDVSMALWNSRFVRFRRSIKGKLLK